MHPQTSLAILATALGFLLKTSVSFCICWALSKIVTSPKIRSFVWFAFLAGACCYWVWLVWGMFSFEPTQALGNPREFLPQTTPIAAWRLDSFWELPLSYAWRAFATLYLLILGSLLAARVRNQMRLRSILHFAYPGPEEVEELFHLMAEGRGIRSARMLVLPGISSPATSGWLSPTVLLPPFCLESEHRADLDVIFRHELEHIQRRDFALQNLASLCRAVVFFHPVMWYGLQQLKLQSELACDLAVIGNSTERRATYAECLVRFARLHAASRYESCGLDFAGSSFPLKTRIRLILSETKKVSRWSVAVRAVFGVIFLAGLLEAVPSLFVALSYEQ